jgi:hypothetical protein
MTGEEQPLIAYLEPDQLVVDKSHPVGRAPLGRRTTAALWALRGFVLVISAMVIYTFISRLGG